MSFNARFHACLLWWLTFVLPSSGRLEHFQELVTSLEPYVHRIINYLKCLPGFLKLPLDDQVSLLKSKRTKFNHRVTCLAESLCCQATGLIKLELSLRMSIFSIKSITHLYKINSIDK